MFGGELDHLSEDQDEDESKDSGDGSIAPLPASPAARASTAASVSSLNGNVDDEEDEKYNTPVARMSQATVLLFDPRSKHRHELRDEMESLVKKVANILYESSLISPSRRPHSRALFQQKKRARTLSLYYRTFA